MVESILFTSAALSKVADSIITSLLYDTAKAGLKKATKNSLEDYFNKAVKQCTHDFKDEQRKALREAFKTSTVSDKVFAFQQKGELMSSHFFIELFAPVIGEKHAELTTKELFATFRNLVSKNEEAAHKIQLIYFDQIFRYLSEAKEDQAIAQEERALIINLLKELKQDKGKAEIRDIWNVPFRRNPFFTGRKDVLKRLHDTMFAKGAAALSQTLAISGLGGIGKTQTAVEYAYQYRDKYKAVLWITAESKETLNSGFVHIAHLLDLPAKDSEDQHIAIAAAKRWLENNEAWLLVFDNADEPELLNDFIPNDQKGHILLTSRAHTFDSLGVLQPIRIDKMPAQEAKDFLLSRTNRTNLAKDEMETMEKLAEELDFLPLALEQAGAYILQMECSFKDYLSSYQQQGLTLIEQAKVAATKYNKSVVTTWKMNFQQVEETSKPAADLLRLSAFFHPEHIPFTLIISGASEFGPNLSKTLSDCDSNPLALDEILQPLTEYSLINKNRETKTYSLHRLVQAVIQHIMDEEIQRQWSERATKGLCIVLPDVHKISNWPFCEQLVPHVICCFEHIKKWKLEFKEAVSLLSETGKYLDLRTHYDEAEPLHRSALMIREKVWGPEHPDTAISLNNLALLYQDQGRYNEAEPLLKRALTIRKKVLGPEHPKTINSLNNLSNLYDDQGRYDEAEPLHRRALTIREKILGPEHPDTAQSLNNLAVLYANQGRYEKAEPLHRRALTICEKVLGPKHPSTAMSLNNLAVLCHDQGRYDEAKLLYERALTIRKEVLGNEHPYTANSLNNLAELYQKQGCYEKAEPLYKRASKIHEKILGPEHPHTAQSFNNLAMLYQEQGRYEEAEPLLKRALMIREQVLGPDHPYTATSLNNLAVLYYNQGCYKEVEPLLKRALTICEKALGPEHPDTTTTLKSYIRLLRKTNRENEAKELEDRFKIKE